MKKPEPKILRYNGWRKLYKCKRNKGDHSFELYFAKQIPDYLIKLFGSSDMKYYTCTACGKQMIDFNKLP